MKSVFITIFFLIMSLSLVAITHAADSSQSSACGKDGICKLTNALGVTELTDIIGVALKGLLGIVGALALLFFVIGGFYWLTSAGVQDKIQKGKDTMMWSAIGLLAVFASYTVLNYILMVMGA